MTQNNEIPIITSQPGSGKLEDLETIQMDSPQTSFSRILDDIKSLRSGSQNQKKKLKRISQAVRHLYKQETLEPPSSEETTEILKLEKSVKENYELLQNKRKDDSSVFGILLFSLILLSLFTIIIEVYSRSTALTQMPNSTRFFISGFGTLILLIVYIGFMYLLLRVVSIRKKPASKSSNVQSLNVLEEGQALKTEHILTVGRAITSLRISVEMLEKIRVLKKKNVRFTDGDYVLLFLNFLVIAIYISLRIYQLLTVPADLIPLLYSYENWSTTLLIFLLVVTLAVTLSFCWTRPFLECCHDCWTSPACTSTEDDVGDCVDICCFVCLVDMCTDGVCTDCMSDC